MPVKVVVRWKDALALSTAYAVGSHGNVLFQEQLDLVLSPVSTCQCSHCCLLLNNDQADNPQLAHHLTSPDQK
jgi:hypothetical protein